MTVNADDECNLRLNFAYQPEEAIYKGIERIGKVLGSF